MTSNTSLRRLVRTAPARLSLLRSPVTAIGLIGFVCLMEGAMNYVGFFNSLGQAIWWPTNGLALALMVRNDRSKWPIILACVLTGSWIGNLRHGWPLSSWIINAIANTAGPILGALLLPRFEKLEDWLQESHLVFKFVAFPLLLAPAVSAAIFASNAHLIQHGLNFWTTFQTRADSDMLGYAMFTPLVLVLSSKERYRNIRTDEMVMSVFLLSLVAASTYVVFWQSSYALIFVPVSVILLASLRLNFAASVLAVNLLACLATTATMHGKGPLTLGAGVGLDHRIFVLQGFLALTMVTIFSVSVVKLEREVFQTKLQLAYKEMEKLATTDALTGLANRRLFEETIKSEWFRAQRNGDSLALLMIDVDHFKSYNDRFGHPAGDACLCAIVQAIQDERCRSSDLLARYGGEEFLLLLPAATIGYATQVAEDIRLRVEGLHERPENGSRCPVSVSVGCAAMTPAPGLFPSLLVAASDEALYRAKRNGRNRVEVSETPAAPFDLHTVL